MNRWISVKDRMPTEADAVNGKVLWAYPAPFSNTGYGSGWHFWDKTVWFIPPTHWWTSKEPQLPPTTV